MDGRGRRGADEEVRYRTRIEDGQVYVQSDDSPLLVGDAATVIEAVGGPAWTIDYSDWERERYPDLDTSDQGLVVDVRDMLAAMEHDGGFVESLRALPDQPRDGDDLSPRMGLFVGKLLENLQSGVQ
ncbi:hypothetical protein [Haloglomus halophilum]|uniref:hypothetical protein n=1 Tax=Haloglomus halophilum TaxID=2962672 RepID=UPI0020C9DCD0|nr:hypothetical protein [Haloglomus halophilum]